MERLLTISDRQPRGAWRVLRFAVCTVALAAALVLSGNPVVYAAGSNYRGKVVARHSDDFAGKRSHFTYLLERHGREDLRLTGATSKLTLGAKTELTGERNGDTVELQSVNATNADPQPAPSGSPEKVAVLLVNFSNDTSQPWTPSEIKQTVFTGPDSVNSYFQEESSGSIYLAGDEDADGDVFGWYTIPNTNASCNYTSFAAAARNQAALDGKDLSNYDNVVYVWPDVAACNWSGLAYLPGDEAFINGAPSLRVISHELSHNLGIHHASSLRCTSSDGQRVFISSSCSFSEYGDPFSVMGSSSSNHSHGWHKLQLGFLPTASMQTVTASGSYQLAPDEQYLPGETQLLRVAHGKTSNGQPDYYYMDLRQPFGSYFDDFLSSDPAVNGVTVRIAPSVFLATQSKLLDGNPQTTSFGDAPLGAGQSASDPATGVTIAPTAVGPGGATVNITINPPQGAQPTSPAPTPGESTNSPVAAAPPEISFSTRSRHVLRTRKLVVSAGCQLGCSLSANATVGLGRRHAKLVPARAGAPAGTPVLLELRLSRSAFKLVKRAKRAGKRVSISLKLSALGSDGQTSSASRRLSVEP